MGVRAKFQVESITERHYAPGISPQKTVRLSPRYDESIPEDQRFMKATPGGSFEMIVENPAALEQLVPGRYFYIDLTPCE